MRSKKLIREKLDNGVTILIQEKPSMRSVSGGIGVRFGAVHHPAAHFLEHLIFKGTDTRGYKQISEDIKQWGGYLEGFSQFYSTIFAGKTLSAYACGLIGTLCEMVAKPAFAEKEIEPERLVMERETAMRQKNPESILRTELYKALFLKHPARSAVSENLELIKIIKRDKLLEIYQKFYVPERLVAVIVGKVNPGGIMKKIDKYFGSLSQGIALPPPTTPKEPRLKKAQRTLLKSPSNHDCSWMLGFRAPFYTDRDYYASKIISAILGDGINSVLFQEIREKRGITYDIKSNYGPPFIPWGSGLANDGSGWHGVFRVYAQFLAKDLPLVEEIAQREIEKLALKSVDDVELKRKQTMLVGQRLLGLEGTLNYLWLLFTAEMNNNMADFENFEGKIFSVTPDDIQRVAKKYFSFNQAAQIIMKQD